jgi:tetratricopeptide (TPR) repeat protein
MVLFSGFFSEELFAQKKMVMEALKALQTEDLVNAKAYIDSAIVHPETKDSSSTWYYRGFIYKKVYNNQEKSNKQSIARDIAIESFKKFFELDRKSELYETAFKSTKYLASTYYNDAATSLNPTGHELAIKNFEKHRNTTKIIEPDHDFSSIEMQFYLVLGQVYNQMYEQDRETNKPYYDKTQEAYLVVLGIDSNNISANYNIAILFYNEGVNIIKNLDYDLDLITLELIQDEVVRLFKQSLPYAERAYRLNPKRKETLIMLSGIYFSLNEMEKSQEIQRQLDELEKTESE